MSIHCDLLLRWTTTPAQLTALGAALWRWHNRAAGAGIYQCLDNQALADLIAGRFPAPGQTPRHADQGIHFRFQDVASQDRQATIESLRQDLPAGGIEDLVVDETSWHTPIPVSQRHFQP